MNPRHPVRLVALLIALLMVTVSTSAQTDSASADSPKERKIPLSVFAGTRLVNGQLADTKKRRHLDFVIGHRFGRLNSGYFNLWGLDESFMRIGFDYGITDRLTAAIGRNTYNKIYDGYLKYRLLAQRDGGSAFTVTAFSSMAVKSHPKKKDDPTLSFFDRVTYTYQMLIGRKFNENVFFQVSPTLLHTNRVDEVNYHHDQFAIGAGGRWRLSDHLGFSAEYYYRVNPKIKGLDYNSLGVALNIVTAGHVFQLVFANSQGMVERTFITQTRGQFFKGDIHFGFNVTRGFGP